MVKSEYKSKVEVGSKDFLIYTLEERLRIETGLGFSSVFQINPFRYTTQDGFSNTPPWLPTVNVRLL